MIGYQESSAEHTAYPPWDINEVARYFIIVLFLTYFGIVITSALARFFIGYSQWTAVFADFQSPAGQTFFYLNLFFFRIALLVLLYVRVCVRYRMSFIEGFRLRIPENFTLAYLIPAGALIYFVVSSSLGSPAGSGEDIPLNRVISSPSGFLYFSILSITIGPLFEELFWRGYAYPAVKKAWGTGAAIAVISLSFSALHVPQLWGAWQSIIVIIFSGVILTVLREASDSTLICLLVHYVYNLSINTVVIFKYPQGVIPVSGNIP